MAASGATGAFALDEALGRAFVEAPMTVVSAYLFGSHAAGRAHADSDVDVGVLLPSAALGGGTDRAKQLFEHRISLGSWLIGELHRNDVDVIVLNDAPPVLARAIVTRGRLVFCADAQADHAYVRDVQLRAADLEPFLRRTRRVKLAAIRR